MKTTIKPIVWLRKHRSLLDVDIRDYVVRKLNFFKFIPCFLHKLVSHWVFHLRRIPVIVEINPDVHQQLNTTKHQLRLQNIRGRYYNHFAGCATRLTLHKLDQMVKQQLVKKVYLDQKVEALLDVATPSVMSQPLWDENVTGKGINVAIVDTGIHPHPDLTEPDNRIVAFQDFVNERTEPYDDNGHGTHCAGDAAGNGTASNGQYRGPAFEANLIGVKVLDKSGSGSLSNVMAGIDWCISHREQYNIHIVSMSLGSSTSGGDDPLAQIVRKAWAKGLIVAAAAGNNGPEPGTISSPGIVPEIITVGATDDNNTTDRADDTVADFSSRGPTPNGVTKPDIVSPGTNIISLRVRGRFLDKYARDGNVNEYYTSLSGTSMATPIVAGIAAQLLQQHPTLTPDEVKEALVGTSESLGEDPNTAGAGLVNAGAAFESLNQRS